MMINNELKLVNGYLDQLFLHINSIVKTSKSYLIKIISSYLKEKTFQYYKTNLILQATLTRVATFNIYSKTFY